MCKRSSPMNMKQLEGLLRDILVDPDVFGLIQHRDRMLNAIKYCQQRQASAKRRSAHFKFLADEQREMLR